MSSDRIDDAIRAITETVESQYRSRSGYKGFTILADRSGGRIMGISFWESEDALKASDELGADARRRAAEAGGGQEPSREVWEVAFDDMV